MKKIIAMFMVIAMITALSVVGANAEITTSGSDDTTLLELTYGSDTDYDGVVDKGANFRVTVPTVIPYSIDSNGNVTTADNLSINNLCNGQVDVTAVHADTVNGWSLAAYGTDFTKVPVDSKLFTMQLNGDVFEDGSSVDLTLGDAWTTIDGNESLALPYDGDFAVQSTAIDDSLIANVIFTVAWHTAE